MIFERMKKDHASKDMRRKIEGSDAFKKMQFKGWDLISISFENNRTNIFLSKKKSNNCRKGYIRIVCASITIGETDSLEMSWLDENLVVRIPMEKQFPYEYSEDDKKLCNDIYNWILKNRKDFVFYK